MLGVSFWSTELGAQRWGIAVHALSTTADAAPSCEYLCRVHLADPPTPTVSALSGAAVRAVILPEHPTGLLPDLQWWLHPHTGHAYARVQQRGRPLAEATITHHGKALTLWADPQVDEADCQQFFASAVIPLVARMQGRFVLHASALELDGHVVAFSAASGTGKSTTLLLTMAALPGATLFADDAIAVHHTGSHWQISAGPQRLKADPKTAALARRLGFEPDSKVFTMGAKVFVDLPTYAGDRLHRLAAFVVVERAAQHQAGSITALPAAEALATLRASRSVPYYPDAAFAGADLTTLVHAINDRHPRVWRVRVPDGLAQAEAWVRATLAPWLRAQAALDRTAT